MLQALGALLTAVPLRYLYRAGVYRVPEGIPRIALPLATFAPVVLAIAVVVLGFRQLAIVDTVLDSLPLSEQGVDELQDDERAVAASYVPQIFGSIGAFALASAFILIARHSRQAGLLSPFMSILGIIVGVILVLGPLLGQLFGALPVVQWFWLAAVAMIFIGRWPGGRGPAWESGEPDPWPSAAEVRAQQAEERGERPPPRRGLFAPPPEPDEEEEDEFEPDDEPAPAGPAHPRSKKRKRKRRR